MAGNEIVPLGGQILIYRTEGGQTKIEVRLENETLWLSQGSLAELYQTTKQNIILHIQNIYDEGELSEDSVVKESLTTAADTKKTSPAHCPCPETRTKFTAPITILNSKQPCSFFHSPCYYSWQLLPC